MTAGVAMQHSNHSCGVSFADYRAGIILGVSGVNDEGLTQLRGEGNLCRESSALRVARGIVVMVVEAALTDRDRRAFEQLTKLRKVSRCVERSGVVRMDSCGREYEAGTVSGGLAGNPGRAERLSDADNRPRPGRTGARDYRVAVAGERRVREVGVA